MVDMKQKIVSSEPLEVIHPQGPKITVAAWGALDKYIVAGRENGSVALIDPQVQETGTV